MPQPMDNTQLLRGFETPGFELAADGSENSVSENSVSSQDAASYSTGKTSLLENSPANKCREMPSLGPPNYDLYDLIFSKRPSEEDVTRMISDEAYSYIINGTRYVTRFDSTQLASNSPCEDRLTQAKFPPPFGGRYDWIAWGIFDGHNGWETADFLARHLLSFVRQKLSECMDFQRGYQPSDVEYAMISGFYALDRSITKSASSACNSQFFPDGMKKIAPCASGSCALLSIFDPDTRQLHVACTGDSRAVLGYVQNTGDKRWTRVLSKDHTCHNEEEVKLLTKRHRGEPNMIKDGKLFGLGVTRAFGDVRWKLRPTFRGLLLRHFPAKWFIPPQPEDFKTPPYLTATPEVTTTSIDSSELCFLIMATAGFWDLITSQQAVELVNKWLYEKERTADSRSQTSPIPQYEPFRFSMFSEGLSRRFVDCRTTIQDQNVAVHLVRNALGGNHHEMIASRLAVNAPLCRDIRDDITVQVIFFNFSVNL
ncbi:putative pyruvate dehydrogenase [Nemania sp. FL0916]|nr:putative pyruvate dehydrogenase [Nemania sp. FL0916]